MRNPFSTRPPPWALQLMGGQVEIMKGINKIMALVQIEQGDLDTVATTLEGMVTAVNGLPKGILPPANEAALQQAVSDLSTAVNAVVSADTPAPPAP